MKRHFVFLKRILVASLLATMIMHASHAQYNQAARSRGSLEFQEMLISNLSAGTALPKPEMNRIRWNVSDVLLNEPKGSVMMLTPLQKTRSITDALEFYQKERKQIDLSPLLQTGYWFLSGQDQMRRAQFMKAD